MRSNQLPDLFCSLSDIARLTPTQARFQVDFLNTLFSKVICTQLLPQAVVAHLAPFNIFLTFEHRVTIPKPPYTHCHGIDLSFASAEIVPSLATKFLAAKFSITPGSKIASVQNEISLDNLAHELKSDLNIRLYLLLKLTQALFSNNGYAIALQSNSTHQTPTIRISKTNLRFDLAVFNATSIPDILSTLISDGYDLSSLKPYLAA